MKPLRGFYGNLNICGHGESLLCSWSICPIRFSVFFVCFFWISWVNLHVRYSFQQHHLFGGNGINSVCFHSGGICGLCILKKNVMALPPTPGGRVNCRSPWFPKWSSRPAASTSPGILLEMQFLRPSLDLLKLWGWGPVISFISPPGDANVF